MARKTHRQKAIAKLRETDVFYVFRNTWAPVLVLATLGMGRRSSPSQRFSFLGFGVQPPAPTWGWTLSYGMRYLREDPWLSSIPGLANHDHRARLQPLRRRAAQHPGSRGVSR